MSTRRLSLTLAFILVCLLTAGTFAVRAFPLTAREASPDEQGTTAGQAEPSKRGPGDYSQSTNKPGSQGSLAPIRVGGNVATSKIIHWVAPEYPAEAQAARVRGFVLLKVTISEAGDVSDVEEVRGNPLLTAAAVAAVRQWKYSPFFLNGRAVPAIATQTLVFPPRTGPDIGSADPQFNPDTMLTLRLDPSGIFSQGAKPVDPPDLKGMLQGKTAVLVILSSDAEYQPEVIQEALGLVDYPGGPRVVLGGGSYRYSNGTVTRVPGIPVPTRQLMEAARAEGYSSFRWGLKVNGHDIRAGAEAVGRGGNRDEVFGAQPGAADAWSVSVTYQLALDASGTVSAVTRLDGDAPPRLDEVMETMIGQKYQEHSPGITRVEVRISLR